MAGLLDVGIAEAAARNLYGRTRAGAAERDMSPTDADRCRYCALAEVETNARKDLDGATETDAHVKWSRAGDACSDCLFADSRSDRLCGKSHGRRCNARLDSDSVYGLTAHATVPKHASRPSNGDHRQIAHH
jgi:ribosomal protein L40E